MKKLLIHLNKPGQFIQIFCRDRKYKLILILPIHQYSNSYDLQFIETFQERSWLSRLISFGNNPFLSSGYYQLENTYRPTELSHLLPEIR